MSTEGATRKVIVAAERLQQTAEGVRDWAERFLHGTLPPEIQALADAAQDYLERLNDYEHEKDSEPHGGNTD